MGWKATDRLVPLVQALALLWVEGYAVEPGAVLMMAAAVAGVLMVVAAVALVLIVVVRFV